MIAAATAATSARATGDKRPEPAGPRITPASPPRKGSEVGIQVVAEEGELHPGLANGFLRVGVVTREREGRRGSGSQDGGVDDVPDSAARGGVDERPVDVASILRLGRRDEHQHVGAAQRCFACGAFGEVASPYLSRPLRCTGRITSQQHGIKVGNALRDQAPERPCDAGDRNRVSFRHSRQSSGKTARVTRTSVEAGGVSVDPSGLAVCRGPRLGHGRQAAGGPHDQYDAPPVPARPDRDVGRAVLGRQTRR